MGYKKIKTIIQYLFCDFVGFIGNLRHRWHKVNLIKIGFICEEFFHERLRGFGGFGMTIKYIAEFCNSSSIPLKAMVCLSTPIDIVKPGLERYHNSDVLLRPASTKRYVYNSLCYATLLYRQRLNALISIEYYPSYEYVLTHAVSLPWIIWIKDPRDEEEWNKIASVDLERQVSLKNSMRNIKKLIAERAESLQRMIELSRKKKRHVYIAAETAELVDIARRLYNIPIQSWTHLPKPMVARAPDNIIFSERPSFLFLGRLDPIKRPWVYFELARRMPNYIFYVAGKTHFPKEINPIIEKYGNVKNLIFLGMIHGVEKDRILKNVWALINTSIHEGVPVSFIEALSYGKSIISCHNAGGLTERFGVYTGEILGNADDEISISRFMDAVQLLVDKSDSKYLRSASAQDYVLKTHNFKAYYKNIERILSSRDRVV